MTSTTIKSIKGEFVIKTEGLDVMSIFSKKSDLQAAIAQSEAHQWIIEYSANKKSNKMAGSNQIPSTETQNFVLKAFYISVKSVVENLVEIENLTVDSAISLGNSLLKGNKFVVDSQIIMSQIKDALRYGTQSGII